MQQCDAYQHVDCLNALLTTLPLLGLTKVKLGYLLG